MSQPAGGPSPARNPRVLHVSQPVVDGVAVVVGDLTDYLSHSGFEVAVACPDIGYLPDRVRDAGQTVLPWEASRNPGPSVPRETRALAELIAGFDPDVVHLHSSKAGLAGRLALRGRRPTVFSPHAWSFYHLDGLMRRAALGWERLGARWSDILLCGSTEEAADGRRYKIRGDYRVIPNSRTISDPHLSREAARRAVGLDLGPGVPLAVCLGRLTHQKGQDVLLAAWPEITRMVPDARLAIVGQGPDLASLQQVATSDVVFGEAPAGARVAEWMLSADVMVFPSRWETLSLAVLESLQLSRPVVVSDCGGMAEALAGGEGTMVPVDDADALAQAVVPYLSDLAFAHAAGERAGEAYRAVHAEQRVRGLTEYEQIIRSLAGN